MMNPRDARCALGDRRRALTVVDEDARGLSFTAIDT